MLKSHDPIVTAAVAAITREAQQQALGSALYVEAVATQLVVHLLRNYASVTFREPSRKGRLSPSQVRRLTEYIDCRLHEQLNLERTHFGKILENGKKIIQIDDREDAFGWFARITVGLEADLKAAVVALLDKLKESGKPGRQPDAKLVQKKKQQKPPAITYDDGKWVDPRRAARYLEDKLPKRDRILVFDGGHALMVAVQTLTSSGADNWTTGADFGAVGQGLSIALGACFARPGKRITHVTADASFMINVADFHTAVSHNLPLTVFVFNDNAVGQERHDLVHKGFPTKYAEVAQPDFEKLAVGFGAKGFRVNRPDDFGEIDKALAVEEGPVIVNIRINGDVELPVSWEIAQHLENTGE